MSDSLSSSRSNNVVKTPISGILANPTPNANYVLDERIMFGWYPCHNDQNNIRDLINTGRNVFVNLTTAEEIDELYHYGWEVLKSVPNPTMIYYPIQDCSLPTDLESYRDLISHLKYLVESNHRLYIHCRGGHGRSGIVVACLLISLGYTNEEALEMVGTAHGTRTNWADIGCPQTSEQVEFVKNYIH